MKTDTTADIELSDVDGRLKYQCLSSSIEDISDSTLTKKKIGPDWVVRTFHRKSCNLYVPSKKNREICCCGRSRDNHHNVISEDVINRNSSIEWNSQMHLTEKQTNAYGEIEFHGKGNTTRAKFIRIANDTPPHKVLHLLLKEWHLEFPKLIISVTGGAKSFKLPSRLKSLFIEGLCKVVQTTGAWVITGGTNTGVMKHVGEALSHIGLNDSFHLHQKINCIGIATWGIVNERKSLTDAIGKAIPYYLRGSHNTKGAYLDNNHTHFLLVDNGYINKYGGEIEFRGKFEKCIRDMTIDKNRAQCGIPGVLLVLEGGPNTVQTVYESITQDRPMPVVVIKGSGRAADLLAFAHGMTEGLGPLFDMADAVEHAQLVKMIEKAYPGMSEDEGKEVYHNILKCVQKKEFITIFQMDEGSSDIDEAILTAFLKGKHVPPRNQLNLAMLWNRVDIARSQLFIEGVKWTDEDLENAMKDALSRNKPEFVKLLREHGVSIGKFLTVGRLEELYNTRVTKGVNILRIKLGKNKCQSGTLKMSDIYGVLKKLLGVPSNPFKNLYKSQPCDDRRIGDRSDSYKNRPYDHLFLWAVLCNMFDMAFCLWPCGKEALAKALVGKILYQRIAFFAEKISMPDDFVESLKQNADKFGVLSVQLLNECSSSNEVLTGQLVTYELKNWGYQTCLSIAVSSNHLDFVAHSCCQNLLSSKWSGALQENGSQNIQVLLGFLVPPYILALKFRSPEQLSKLIMTQEEHKKAIQEQKSEKRSPRREEEKRMTKHDSLEGTTSSLTNMSYNISNKSSMWSGDSLTTSELSQLCWYEKIHGFYTAPVTKFWVNVIAYILFLMLFCFVISTELPQDPFNTEWLLVLMVFTLFTEEVRQLLESEANSFSSKFVEWSSSYWNLCDAIAITLFFVGFGLRMNDSTILAGHVVYAIDIIFFILRLLDIFSVNKYLGPYVVMIGRMTIDMGYFMFVLLIFLLAYGVSRYAILNPKEKRSWATLGKFFFVPYFQMYGELFMDYPVTDATQTLFRTEKHYGHIQAIVAIIMSIYLLIVNILLLNILIAKFNNTYTSVQDNANVIWKFGRYHLIQEYSTRPWLAPPLIIFSHVYRASLKIWKLCCSKETTIYQTDRILKKFLTPEQLNDLMKFEERCLSKFLRKRDNMLLATQEERLRMISERVDTVAGVFTELNSEVQSQNKKTVSSTGKLEDRLDRMEMLLRTLTSRMEPLESLINSNVQEPMAKFWHRSISEYPGNPSKAAPVLSSPSSMPNTLYNRRMSNHSFPFPNRSPDSSKMVRRAAYTFRKNSLLANSILLDRIGENQDRDEEESWVRRNTFPTRRTTSTDSGNSDIQSCPPQQFGEYQSGDISIENDFTGQSNTSSTSEQPLTLPATLLSGNSDGNSDGVDYDETDHGPRFLHRESRTATYPLANVKRFDVPDSVVPWEVPMDKYDPPSYTSYTISSQPNWADKEINGTDSSIEFNVEGEQVNRTSYLGKYPVVNGLPRNPMGRTGLTGRGLLAHYGPNHIGQPIFTRWSRGYCGMGRDFSDVLEVLVVAKKRSEISLPSGVLESYQKLPKIIFSLFSDDTLQRISLNAQQTRFYMTAFQEIIQEGKQVYEGYLDDPRNTDNAWLEVTVYNYHDNAGTVLSKFLLDDETSKPRFQWAEVRGDINLPQSQRELLQMVAEAKNAHFG